MMVLIGKVCAHSIEKSLTMLYVDVILNRKVEDLIEKLICGLVAQR